MGNAANPNEDEQGRCRTDMSGRTNELNPEYQGMKGSVKDEKSWTLWRTIMMTPIGIPIELKIEAVLGYGMDFGIGSGGDGQVKTCMKAKLASGKCPEKSLIVRGSGDTAGKTGSAQDVVIGPDGNCMYAAESPIVGWSKFSAKARGGWDSSIKYFPCDETQEAGNKDPQMKPWVLNGFEAKVKDKATTMVQQTCDSGVASSTGVTCSGCGYMVLVAPYIKAMLRAQGGINLFLVQAGIGIEVEILKITLPLSGDIAVGNDWNKNCANAQLVIGSGGGRVYLYVDTIFTDQIDFDLYSWDGLSYTWPGGGGFWGICSGIDKADKETTPEPGYDELMKKCWVGVYGKTKFSGKPLNEMTPTEQTGGVYFPGKGGEFSGYSLKLKGQCARVELFDNDGGFDGENSADSLKTSFYWSQDGLPNDLNADVAAMKVYAGAPVNVTIPPSLADTCKITLWKDEW